MRAVQYKMSYVYVLEEDVYTGPPEVPEDWRPIWEYSYTRSWGDKLRATILDILKNGDIQLFFPGQGLSGDIIEIWNRLKINKSIK